MEHHDFEFEWLWTSNGATISFLTSILGLILYIGFVWKQLKQDEEDKSGGDQSICKSPNCVRCQQNRKSNEIIINTLKERCQQYLTKQYRGNDSEETLATQYPRVLSTISSLTEKSSILQLVYKSSGHDIIGEIAHHPHIWTVPDLRRAPFWDSQMCSQLQSIASKLLTSSTFEKILSDYKRANSTSEGWRINTTPNGQWKIYPLFNQGQKIDKNCKNCSETLKILDSFPTLMQGCIYGNAMFSVLQPGSVIEPHTGPCNFRLRCHLPLIVPAGFKVQVGMETGEWRVGELLVFDDSFVHRVWYEASDNGNNEFVFEDDCRVVLIFDIWHPELNSGEIGLLSHCFSEPY